MYIIKKMLRVILLATTGSLLVFTTMTGANPKKGSVAPSFNIKSTEGHMVDSKDLKGKVVVMFFGTRTVSDYVNELHLELEETYKGKDVAVFTVAINPPSFMPDVMLKKLSKTPMLIDRGGKMSQAFDVADPDGDAIIDLVVVLIDKNWKIKSVSEEDTPDDFESIIDACWKELHRLVGRHRKHLAAMKNL